MIIFGRMEIVEDMDKIIGITTALAHKFTQDEGFISREIERFAKATLLMKLTPEHICGKRVKEE